MSPPWSSIDDEWVKWHSRDADVEAMYRYVQEPSRLLHGQGAGLDRARIADLRSAAGERPWGAP
jgi:hypothetical protein